MSNFADSLLERVMSAAEQRQFSAHTLTAYRRTWPKLIAWAAAAGLAPETLPTERAGEFHEFATRGRSASHHLQVKAAFALLYKVLSSPNPFVECLAPKFQIEKTEMRYHTPSQLGQLLSELREDRRSYFGHLTYHLATALFFTGCRFHEWAQLTIAGGREVATQEERGLGYRNYVEQSAATGLVIGIEWFTLNDQAVTGRYFQGYDGERANTGVIAVTDRPWKLALAEMIKTNYDIYKVWLGERLPFAWDDPRFKVTR